MLRCWSACEVSSVYSCTALFLCIITIVYSTVMVFPVFCLIQMIKNNLLMKNVFEKAFTVSSVFLAPVQYAA